MLVWWSVSALAIPVCADGVAPPCAESLQDALDQQPTGTAYIELAPGTYAMSLDVGDRDVQIARRDPATEQGEVWITGDGVHPVFAVNGGSLVVDGAFNFSGSVTTYPSSYTSFLVVPTRGRALEAYDAVVSLSYLTLAGSGEAPPRGGVLDVTFTDLTLDRAVVRDGEAVGAGGLLYAENSQVKIAQSRLERGIAGTDGGLVALDGGGLEIAGGPQWFDLSRFTDGRAGRFGGAIAARASVDIDRASFQDNVGYPSELSCTGTLTATRLDVVAVERGPTNLSMSAGRVTVEDSRFQLVGDVNAIYSNDLTLRRSTVCGGSRAAWADSGYALVENNLFIGMKTPHIVLAQEATARHNTVIGGRYEAFFAMAFVGGATLPGDFGENVFVDVTFDELTTQSVGDHNLWWPAIPSSQQDGTQRVGDPQLPAFPLGEPCPKWTDAALIPSWWGAGRDAGRPDEVDPDGTRADLGAYGAVVFDVDYAPAWDDEDADGVPRLYDCDPEDPMRSPLAANPAYDGIDQDCHGDDDFDADRDGERPWLWGGLDCDDTDARRGSTVDEVDGNGIDDDCDGWADSRGTLRPRGGCSAAPADGWAWLALLPALRGRRGWGRRPRSAGT